MNMPSRAMAYGTRAPVSVAPLRAPRADSTNAIDISLPPLSPNAVWAALVATGSASRCAVEFEVRTSAQGSAKKYMRFAEQ